AYANRVQIARFAQRNRLPAMYGTREFVDAGGLMAFGPSAADQWRRAATYVDKLLKGARPADLPVEQPTKFELVINLKAAQTLGLTIPPSLRQRADHVVECPTSLLHPCAPADPRQRIADRPEARARLALCRRGSRVADPGNSGRACRS